jgi:hypothetical protein
MKIPGELLIIYNRPAIVTVVKRNGAFSFKHISWPRYWFIIFRDTIKAEWEELMEERKVKRMVRQYKKQRLTSRLFGGKR